MNGNFDSPETFRVFISYAHEDNAEGWVDTFHQKLMVRLKEFGEKIEFFFDKAGLPGHQIIRETLRENMGRADILVAILSPNYLNSSWCLEELEWFCPGKTHAANRREVVERIFKIRKTVVEPDRYRTGFEYLRDDLVGYPFFEEVDGIPHHFSSKDAEFVREVEKIAWHITEKIKALRTSRQNRATTREPAAVSAVTDRRRTVYLAETVTALDKDRDDIKSELERHSYQILPVDPLARNVFHFEKQVREDLRRSSLSLHLIGREYGVIPEGEKSDRSNVCLQYQFACEEMNNKAKVDGERSDSDLSPLLWIPMGMESDEDKQKRFLEALGNESVEMLSGTRENVKSTVLARLGALNKPVEPPRSRRYRTLNGDDVEAYSEYLELYFMFDRTDAKSTEKLREHLLKSERCYTSELLDDTENRAERERELLASCQGAVIYQNQSNREWREQKLSSVRKEAARDPLRRPLIKALYLAGDSAQRVENIYEAHVVREREEIPTEELSEFVNDVRKDINRRAQLAQGAAR